MKYLNGYYSPLSNRKELNMSKFICQDGANRYCIELSLDVVPCDSPDCTAGLVTITAAELEATLGTWVRSCLDEVRNEADEEDTVEPDLDDMTRDELVDYIAIHRLPIEVSDYLSNADLRDAIDEVLAECPSLDEMDRSELLALIDEEEMDVVVEPWMSDDDIRDAIEDAAEVED